jgi:hypothetical protein
VVAVESRVNDELNVLVVRRDMEKSQPDCLEQSQLDIKKQSQPDCLEQSQSDCMKQTVVMKMCGEILVECMRCGFATKGYKRGRLKKRLENHLLKCPVVTPKVEKDQLDHNTESNRHMEQKVDIFDAVEPKTKTAEPINVGEEEKLAQSDSKANKFDAAMRKSLDHIVEADTAKALKAKMTIDEQGQFVEVWDSDMYYKLLTGSGTGPLYKYLRYKIPTAVGAVTKVDVFDTGGTTKTAANPDFSSRPDDPGMPDVFGKPEVASNVESLCTRKTRLECKKMTVEAMVISQDADEGEKLAKSDNKASKFDDALREIVDTAKALKAVCPQV